MEYNERLMSDALQGSKDALKELKSNAGAGSAEAQYYLAMYHAKVSGGEHDPDYQYWMKKAIDNGYETGIIRTELVDSWHVSNEKKKSVSSYRKHNIWFYFGLEGRVNRSFYVLSTIVYFVLSTTLSGYIKELSQSESNGFVVIVLAVLCLTLSVLWIALSVKRLHDLNCSGWLIFVPLVQLWLFCAKGSNEENDYGEPM